MHEDDAPYRSPTSTSQPTTLGRANSSRSTLSTLAYLCLPLVGGFVGFTGYILASIILEKRNTTTEPILAYGQQAGLISLPMCTFIVAATGLGAAFAMNGRYITPVLLLLAVSCCGWAINNSLWSEQIKMYGPDPSEAVLYYPPAACSGIALAAAVVIAAWAILSSRKQVS